MGAPRMGSASIILLAEIASLIAELSSIRTPLYQLVFLETLALSCVFGNCEFVTIYCFTVTCTYISASCPLELEFLLIGPKASQILRVQIVYCNKVQIITRKNKQERRSSLSHEEKT